MNIIIIIIMAYYYGYYIALNVMYNSRLHIFFSLKN